VAQDLPDKLHRQIEKAGLPTTGKCPFIPRLEKNRKGEPILAKSEVKHGPKRGKVGYLDEQGRIWIKDRAHADVPDHWDVQENGGEGYFRVDLNGNRLS
jgi:hypothetical protein